jgi:hypothetical protein
LRRQNNILHQYQELETTTDMNVSPRVTTTTITTDRNRWSSIPLNAISTNEIMAPSPTEISTPLLHQEAPTSPIPLHDITTKTTASTVTKDDNSYDTSTDNINNNENSSKTIEKSMRPSEYRAKRRSLLVQAPLTNPQVPDPYTYHTRPRPSSGLSVGGILPDETIPTETSSFRRSWRSSSGSSVAYSLDSSAPSSPPVDRRFTSQRPTHNTLDEDLHRFDEQVVYIDQHFKSDMSKRKG